MRADLNIAGSSPIIRSGTHQGRSDQWIRIALRSTRAQMRGSRRSAIVILWPSRETRQMCPCGRNPGGAGPLRPWYRVAPRSLAAHLFALGQLRSVRLVRGSAKTPARSQQLIRPSLGSGTAKSLVYGCMAGSLVVPSVLNPNSAKRRIAHFSISPATSTIKGSARQNDSSCAVSG